MLIGSIAFSNLQRNYGTPTFICGLLVDEKKLTKLNEIKTKGVFEPQGTIMDDPFYLTKIEKEIEEYLSFVEKKVVLDFPSKDGKRILMKKGEVDEAIKIIQAKLIYGDLTILPESVKEVHLRDEIKFENQPTVIEDNQSGKLTDYFINSNLKIVIEQAPNFSKIMELARLFSWKEYIIRRRKNPLFVKQFLENNKEFKLSQYLRVSWPRSRIETYPNSYVGLPEIIVKQNQKASIIPLTLNQKISIFPFAKSCIGQFNQDSNLQICVRSKDSRCGLLLSPTNYEERCSRCRTAIDRLKFDSKSIAKLANEEDPLEGYSDAFHYVYITKFSEKLKIGRARLSRGISRLIEQSCADALVIFPILSFKDADRLEHCILDYLKEKLENLREIGIEKVSDKGFMKDKIVMIENWCQNSIKSNENVYQKILEILKQNDELKTTLEVTNQRILDLKPNWHFDKKFDFTKSSNGPVYWTKVEGEVKGIIGSLLFLENKIIDMEKMQGWLFTGEGFN